jgi:hypothetical protein
MKGELIDFAVFLAAAVVAVLDESPPPPPQPTANMAAAAITVNPEVIRKLINLSLT